MSNKTDLDWLARNVHVWREGKHEVLVSWPRNVGTLTWSSVSSTAGWITKEQWLARRAELQNKPSWKDAPEWAEWMAQDDSGEWYWYASKPTHPGMESWWPAPGANNVQCGKGEVLGDRRDTLEKRPEEFQPFTSIEDNQEKAMKQDNGWHERGELPPVGTECEIDLGAKWRKVFVVGHNYTGRIVVEVDTCDFIVADGCTFRPIPTERDKLVELIKTYRHTFRSDTEFADAILAAGFKRGTA